jgi:hypothetical protein
MNKLFFMRISDRPQEVRTHHRKSRYNSLVDEVMYIFSVNGKKYTFTKSIDQKFKVSNLAYIAELGPYDNTKVKSYPASAGNPGGYPVARLQCVWLDTWRGYGESPASAIREFIQGSSAEG